MKELTDEVLSAEMIGSAEEVLADYKELCEEAARTHSLTPADLANAVRDLCRMLDRNHRSET